MEKPALETQAALEPEPEPDMAADGVREAAASGFLPEVRWLYGPPVEVDEKHFDQERGDEYQGRSFNVSVQRPPEGGRSRRRRRRARASGESSFTLSRYADCSQPCCCVYTG